MPFAALIPFESADLAEQRAVISPTLKAASRAVSSERTSVVSEGFFLATCSEGLNYSDIVCALCNVAGYSPSILFDVKNFQSVCIETESFHQLWELFVLFFMI